MIRVLGKMMEAAALCSAQASCQTWCKQVRWTIDPEASPSPYQQRNNQ